MGVGGFLADSARFRKEKGAGYTVSRSGNTRIKVSNTISMLREGFADLGEGVFLVGEGVAMIGNAVAQQKNCPPASGELLSPCSCAYLYL